MHPFMTIISLLRIYFPPCLSNLLALSAQSCLTVLSALPTAATDSPTIYEHS